METLVLITALIQFIVLIKFFQLVGSVKEIRTKLGLSTNPGYWLSQYEKNIILNRDREALYCLQEYVWLEIKQTYTQSKLYEELKTKYEESFLRLGSAFPVMTFKKSDLITEKEKISME